MLRLERFSFGSGDRFGREGVAQLRAIQRAAKSGIDVVPVWNKSNREHLIVGTSPDDLRREADDAVRTCGWNGPYYVDADHIGLNTVDRFLTPSNFFTIDVADCIGQASARPDTEAFVASMKRFIGKLEIPGIARPFDVTTEFLTEIAGKYLAAVREAGRVFRLIESKKGKGNFIPEVSVDEASLPQSPAELFFVLAALAEEKVPVQTIAPKFTGAFLKGVDYVGDVERFQQEFAEDIAVLAHAVRTLGFPDNLKLSVHSGSDKFSLYPVMNAILSSTGAGVHVKTAGTTWLEEVIGMASAGKEGLRAAKEIYTGSLDSFDELCQPYASVIDIDKNNLPAAETVSAWDSEEFVGTLRHDPGNELFNRDFRQLIHVGYKVAVRMGDRFRNLLDECREAIEENVTMNLLDRHVRPLFPGRPAGREGIPTTALDASRGT